MKKRSKRSSAKSSSKGSRAKGQHEIKTGSKAQKTCSLDDRGKVKSVAKKAAKAAVVAGGLAAVETALNEVSPTKSTEAGTEGEQKR